MIFRVQRTSRRYDDEIAPVAGARKDKIARWDRRTCTAEEFDRKNLGGGKSWFDVGSEHQEVVGPRGGKQGIKRRMDDVDAWFIELADLDALMEFFGNHGNLILTVSNEDEATPTIEIYDDYRE